jgi:hypothetical protein
LISFPSKRVLGELLITIFLMPSNLHAFTTFKVPEL